MKLTSAIDLYLEDMAAQGRINSAVSERSYRDTLEWHSEDVQNRDPRYTNRDDVKRTLNRWANPNTRSKRRSYLVSFYRWLMEEGFRKDNPAEQTPRPKRRPVSVYRLTFEETVKMLAAARTPREKRAVFLCVCCGLRSQEVRGMRGCHFQRPGWVHVSADVAKGNRERWVPMLPDLEPVIAEIVANAGPEDYVLPALRTGNPGINTRQIELPQRPCSQQSLGDLVATVARRAGIAQHIYPHLLRHAFADHIARYAGMRNAQFLLGHSSVSTTEGYLGKPTMGELEAAVGGFSFGIETTGSFETMLPVSDPREAATSGGLAQEIGAPMHEATYRHIAVKNGDEWVNALVDAEDYDRLADHPWRLEKGYAKYCRKVDGKLRHFFLHREVLGFEPGDGQMVDHVNGEPLDCRKGNLRPTTHKTNAQNRRGANRGSLSEHRGVTYHRASDRWRAQVWLDGKNHSVGEFGTEEEAAVAAAAFRAEYMPFSEVDAPSEKRMYVLGVRDMALNASNAPGGIRTPALSDSIPRARAETVAHMATALQRLWSAPWIREAAARMAES